MGAVKFDLEIDQGTDVRFSLELTTGGVPINLTDAEIYSQIRLDFNSVDKTDFTIDITDAVNGVVVLSLTNVQTALLIAGRDYVYDIKYKDSLDFVRKVIYGTVTILPCATKLPVIP